MTSIISGKFFKQPSDNIILGFQKVINKDMAANQESHKQVYQYVLHIIDKYTKLSGFYSCEGETPPSIAKAVIDAKKVGKIKIVGHDLVNETMRYLKQGVITATLGQNPFAQGYDPIIHLFNHITTGWKPVKPRLLTKLNVVNNDNYLNFWDSDKGIIQTEKEMKHLAQTAEVQSTRSLRFAVLGEEGTFWNQVQKGVQEAAKRLSPYQVSVDYYVPGKVIGEEKLQKNYSKKAHNDYQRMIEKLIEDKIDGIATLVVNPILIPLINNAVESGIPVISFNCEPYGIRSLISTITDQAQELIGLSRNLASSAYETGMAISQINRTMNDVAKGTVHQNQQVVKTREILCSLLNNIQHVNREANQSADASVQTSKVVVHGVEALGKTLESIGDMEKSVEGSWRLVQELGNHSEQIDGIVKLITDIAARVNVLSTNASIEATQSGEFGKGFMVVTKEIRKLAKNTHEATNEIASLVNSVQSNILQVEKEMENSLEKLKKSTNLTDESKKALDEIRKRVEEDKNRVQRIAEAIDQIQHSSHEVGVAMDGVASVSESNSEVVKQVNIATGEMNNQIETVTENARSLEVMAQSELELLAKYDIKGDDKN